VEAIVAEIRARFRKQFGTFRLDVDLRLPTQGVSVLFGRSGSGKPAGSITPVQPKIKTHPQQEPTMLQSYSAQLKGNQLIWLDQTPVCLPDSRVLVVVETSEVPLAPSQSGKYDLCDLVGQLSWRGDAVAAQRAQRDAW
jgi:hypothetical protein